MDLADKIKAAIQRNPNDYVAYDDLFSHLRNIEDAEFARSHALSKELRGMAGRKVRERGPQTEKFFDLYRRTLLYDAPWELDSFQLYIEIDRRPEERFYMNRRSVLMPIVKALQDLADDKLDELFLSTPPRIGKTTEIIFFLTWMMGRQHEHPNLYSSYTDVITRAMYGGVLEILTDKDTYKWSDVFPGVALARTNAQDETIDLGRRKHYPTLTCRSIDGTLNGACDAENGIIIGDDLVSGIEEALSKDRQISKWGNVDNNLIPRGKGKTKYCWIGTRWSVLDPAGIRLDVLQNDEKYKDYRYRVINIPALNESDESNFNYPHGVGFDTTYYHRRRASFERNNDIASWLAQYMGEPIEREGALFTPDGFRYYNGVLPEGEPDRVFLAIDPAFGGGDFVSAPVCVQYGDDVYVPAVVYDNRDKTHTIPACCDEIEKFSVGSVQVEANKMTESYTESVGEELKKRKLKVNLTSKPAPTTKSKLQRIFDKAPDIREHFIFLESGKRPKEYEMFMQNVYSFKVIGKNKNDDAPDSLSMAADMLTATPRQIGFFKRPF